MIPGETRVNDSVYSYPRSTYDNIMMTSSEDVYYIQGRQKDNGEDESCGCKDGRKYIRKSPWSIKRSVSKDAYGVWNIVAIKRGKCEQKMLYDG